MQLWSCSQYSHEALPAIMSTALGLKAATSACMYTYMRSMHKESMFEGSTRSAGSCVLLAASAPGLHRHCQPTKKPYNVAILLKETAAVGPVGMQSSQWTACNST